MNSCTLCPRRCGADREKTFGACHANNRITLSRAALHFGEEPCLAGKGGSGAVFFSGCNLGCAFCQNRKISHAPVFGIEVDETRFSEILLELQDGGAENIDLVTPTHFTPAIARVLKRVRDRLHVPVIWNSSAYESVETLRRLEGLVDIYLPDFKFVSSTLSAALCHAPDYAKVASSAISEMYRQTGPVVWAGDHLTRGVLVRHLVLPGHSDDSLAVLDRLDRLFFRKDAVCLSLMRQYTPLEGAEGLLPSRPVTTLEYERVLSHAAALGFCGFSQEKSSATQTEIPFFDGTGVQP